MMGLPRPASPASSSASSLDSNGLPVGRIKCSKDKIFVGDHHYQSATDALLAYLRQFETVSGSNGATSSAASVSSRGSSRHTAVAGGTGGSANGSGDGSGETTPRSMRSTRSNRSADLNSIGVEDKKDEVQQLLTSKVSPELKEEVTDTLREIKLKNLLKKAVSKSQKPGKTGLQQEVEAALVRSAQLLEKVTMEDMQSHKQADVIAPTDSVISDVSLPTQLLLADINNSIHNSIISNGSGRSSSRNNSSDSMLSQELEDAITTATASANAVSAKRVNGHVYSYHTANTNTTTSPTDLLLLNRSINSSGLLSPSDIILHHHHNLRQSRQRHRRHNLSHDDLTLSTISPHHHHLHPHHHHQHLLPSSQQRLLSNSSSASSSSSAKDNHTTNILSENLHRIRSRSVPSNAVRNREIAPSPHDSLNGVDWHRNRPSSAISSNHSASISNIPNWVKDEAGSNLNSMFSVFPSDQTSKPAIPQWVEDVAKSDITVDNIIAQHNSRLVTNGGGGSIHHSNNDINNTNSLPRCSNKRANNNLLFSSSASFSKSEGDLSKLKHYNDDDDDDESYVSKFGGSSLNLSNGNPASSSLNHAHNQQPLDKEKHVTFTDSPSSSVPAKSSVPTLRQQPAHSTPLRAAGRQQRQQQQQYRQRAASLIGVDGHTAIMGTASNGPTMLVNGGNGVGGAGSDIDSDLKSSSLDTLALLTGKPYTRHKGPGILNGSSLGSKMFPDAPLLSSIEQDRTPLSPGSSSMGSHMVTSSDGLDGDRSWEKHTNAFKPPVPVGNGDCRHGNESSENAKKNSCSSLSGGNQPGSMETLKNMLFRLQKEDPSVTSSTNCRDPGVTGGVGMGGVNGSKDTPTGPETTPPPPPDHTSNPHGLPALKDYDFQTEPGGHSLEKALHHLDRLKTLVKNTATTTNGQADLVNGVGE